MRRYIFYWSRYIKKCFDIPNFDRICLLMHYSLLSHRRCLSHWYHQSSIINPTHLCITQFLKGVFHVLYCKRCIFHAFESWIHVSDVPSQQTLKLCIMSFQLHHFTITFSYGPKQPIKLLRKILVYQCKENKQE